MSDLRLGTAIQNNFGTPFRYRHLLNRTACRLSGSQGCKPSWVDKKLNRTQLVYFNYVGDHSQLKAIQNWSGKNMPSLRLGDGLIGPPNRKPNKTRSSIIQTNPDRLDATGPQGR